MEVIRTTKTNLPAIFQCISDKSKVKKDQTRVFFGQVNEKNQVQLMDKGPGLPQAIILPYRYRIKRPEDSNLRVSLGCP